MSSVTWFVYLVRCADDSLYCGVTTDLQRRLGEHNQSPRGARYTRSRRPVELAWYWQQPNRSEACRQEAWVKSLDRFAKEQLLLEWPVAGVTTSRIWSCCSAP